MTAIQPPLGPIALTRSECERLLRRSSVGRVAFTDGALPQVTPVNYAIDGNSVIFRTTPNGRLAQCCRDAVVAFEVDDVDPETHSGWSVLIVGDACAVTDESDVMRVRQLPFAPWAPGQRDHYIRITPGMVTGRTLQPLTA
jgi:nitroimidazol reductase NimA-like FMN-containing flavoprotein (pyridoxamine 5'-phosphate oxidase superfamily)